MKFCKKAFVKLPIIVILLAFVQACAIMDISPKQGYPEPLSENGKAPSLLPSKSYQFDADRRL